MAQLVVVSGFLSNIHEQSEHKKQTEYAKKAKQAREQFSSTQISEHESLKMLTPDGFMFESQGGIETPANMTIDNSVKALNNEKHGRAIEKATPAQTPNSSESADVDDVDAENEFDTKPRFSAKKWLAGLKNKPKKKSVKLDLEQKYFYCKRSIFQVKQIWKI